MCELEMCAAGKYLPSPRTSGTVCTACPAGMPAAASGFGYVLTHHDRRQCMRCRSRPCYISVGLNWIPLYRLSRVARQGVSIRLNRRLGLRYYMPSKHRHSFYWVAAVPAVPARVHQRWNIAHLHSMYVRLLPTFGRWR